MRLASTPKTQRSSSAVRSRTIRLDTTSGSQCALEAVANSLLREDAMKILLIEDDKKTSTFLIRGLKKSGHIVDHAIGANASFLENRARQYDIIIVDRMLPEIDGLTLVKLMRRFGIKTPILFLTTMGGIKWSTGAIWTILDEGLIIIINLLNTSSNR